MLKLSKKVRTIPEEADELGKMIRAVRSKRAGEQVFCVMRSEETPGMMEIVRLAFAKIEAEKHDVTVFGLAGSRENALELVREIVDEMAKQGRFDVSEFL